MVSRIKGTVLAAFVVLGCREAAVPASCDPPITSGDRPLLEVQFTENLRIRGCSRATLHSETGAFLFGLQAALNRADVVKVEPLFDSWYYMALTSGADTSKALATLRARSEIANAYVHSDVIPPPSTSYVRK